MNIVKQFSVSALSVVVISSLALSGMFTATARAEMTVEQMMAMIAQLQAQLAAMQGGTTTPTTTEGDYLYRPNKDVDYEFTKFLKQGMSGNEVLKLQQALNSKATGYFGPITKGAVQAFQSSVGLVADGYVGPISRGKLNEKATVTTETGIETETGATVTGDKLVVEGEMADDMVVGESQTVIVSKLTLYAGDEDVDVKHVEVKYSGTADDDDVIDTVALLDSTMLELDTDTLNSSGEGKLKVSKTVKDGESLVLYVAIKTIAFGSDDNGLNGTVKVTEVTTDGTDVEGDSVEGATHEFHASVNVSNFEAEITQEKTGTVKIGEEGVKVAVVNIENKTTSDDKETVKAIKLERTGTAVDDSLDNVEIEVDGETYSSTQDTDNKYTFDFGDGIELEEAGDDMDFVVYVDVEDDTAKTFAFEISDVVVVDEDGVVLPEGVTTDVADPNDDDGDSDTTEANSTYDLYEYEGFVTIALSDVTISKTTDVQSDKVAAGQDTVDLVSFDVEVTGKDVTGDLEVTIKLTGGSGASYVSDIDVDNVAVYDEDGDRISDREDTSFTAKADNTTYVVTIDDVTFEAGDDAVDYVLKGDINKDAPTGTKYQVTQVKYVSIEDADDEDISDVTETIATPAQIEVEAATITVSVENADDTDVNSDADDVVVAEVKLDADNSGDDVKVTQVKLKFELEELAEVFAVTFANTWATTDTAVFDGTTITLGATQTPNAMAILVEAGTYTNFTTSISGDIVTFTQKVAADLTDIDSTTFVITTAGDGTGTVATPTTQGSDADINDVRQCGLFDGTTSVSDKETAAASVTYNVDVTVTKDTEKVLTVQCDLGSDFNNGNKVKITGINFDARGVVTDLKLDTTFTTNTTVTITDGSAEFDLSSDDENDAKVVKDDDEDVVLGNYEFKAKDASLTIDDITVTFDEDITAEFDGQVDVYINDVKEDSVTPVTTTASFTNLAELVDKDETVTIEFRADMELANASIYITSVAMTTDEAVTVTTEADDGPIITIVAAIPVITQVNVDIDDLSTANDVVLFAYKIKADGGDVIIDDMDFTATYSNVVLANDKIFIYDNADMTGSAQFESAVLAAATTVEEGVDIDLTISENDTYYVFYVSDVDVTDDARSIRVQMNDDATGIIFTTPAITGEKLLVGDMKSLLKKD